VAGYQNTEISVKLKSHRIGGFLTIQTNVKSIDAVLDKAYNIDTEEKEVAYGTVEYCGAN